MYRKDVMIEVYKKAVIIRSRGKKLCLTYNLDASYGRPLNAFLYPYYAYPFFYIYFKCYNLIQNARKKSK